MLWNHVQNVIPEFRALMGPRVFGVDFGHTHEIQIQILGVAFAAQFYMLRKHHHPCENAVLARSLWQSKPFYLAFLKRILRQRDSQVSSVSSAP